MKLSFIVPLFNEQEVIYNFHEAIIKQLLMLEYEFELIYVDDGSSDNTFQIINELCEMDNKVKFISFTRNFGHQFAILAGLENCSGDAIIMLDGDLQHPVNLIPKLVKKWEAGFKIVQTIRIDKNVSFFKKISSAFFYKLLNLISDYPINKSTADFRLIDKEVLKSLLLFKEQDIFLRGLIPWLGYKTKYIKFDVEKRYSGESKYTLFKMIKFALVGITSFSIFPLRIASIFGFLIAIFSFGIGLHSIIIKLVYDTPIVGWTSIIVGVFFIGGINLFSLGIIGEYIGKSFIQTKRRPRYLIKKNNI